jgi:hypothetical protein
MCKDQKYTLFLRSFDAEDVGNGKYQFDNIDMTHWPRSRLWHVRCVTFVMSNGAPQIADAAIELAVDGVGNSNSSGYSPVCIATRTHNQIYRADNGPTLVGDLPTRSLTCQIRSSDQGNAVATDDFVAILECVPIDSE